MNAPRVSRSTSGPRRTFGARLPLLALVLLACGAPPTPAPRQAPSSEAPPSEARPPDDPRALGPAPRFADLVAAARTLDDRRDQESNAGCLLRRGWRLEADLAVAVRPLPPAPDDLDDTLARHPGPVNILSRWGAYGSGAPSAPSFSAVTTTLPPRREPALVWALTDEGVYVRSSREPMSAAPIALDALSLPEPDAVGALFITAEAGTSLERLAQLLARAPDALAGRVGLAVALAPETRLPEIAGASAPVDPRAHLCPGGLPALADDAPLGDLRPDAIVQRLDPLRQAASACVSASEGPGAAGGRVVLGIRIGPGGVVTDACAVEDATADPALRGCLVRAARSVAFPAPSPDGSVDVQLPLLLAPLALQHQAPLCP